MPANQPTHGYPLNTIFIILNVNSNPEQKSEAEPSVNFGEPQEDALLNFGEPQEDALLNFGEPQEDALLNFGEPQEDALLNFGKPQEDALLNFGEPQEDALLNFGEPQEDALLNFGERQEDALLNLGELWWCSLHLPHLPPSNKPLTCPTSGKNTPNLTQPPSSAQDQKGTHVSNS
ncbi:bile salt-activated lipase-like [Crotalus adamanteus]|uniref:Bile salt-activated lipase-like n=1 Tax=Crotalus adamanteus TaxID=8729 RepID=A0AAW1AUU6_CROAD